MKVVDLKVLMKEHGLRGYSKLKKAKLITFLQNNLQPTPAPYTKPPKPTRPPPPPPQMSTWEPIDDRQRQASPLVKSRQPSDSQNPRPYQLRPKRGKETFIEPSIEQKELPPSNLKQIKCMKKKLGKLNKKIRHSKRKHNNLISK